MIKKVFVVVVACIHLVNCAATIAIGQKTSSGEYPVDTLLVDFSMISESCANETIDLISKSYYLDLSITTCSLGLNDTYSRCEINFNFQQYSEYQNDCNTLSGAFYSDTEIGDDPSLACIYTNGDLMELFATNYPFCAGISCNESEILLAYDAMMLADSESGQLGQTYSAQCGSFIILRTATSNAYQSYIAGGIIYVTLAMFSIVLLLSL